MPLAASLPDLKPYLNLLLLFLPLLITHSRRVLHTLRHPSPRAPSPPLSPRTRQLWAALIGLHTVQQLVQLTVWKPPNIFRSLHAPISAPVGTLQTILRLAPGSVSPAVATPKILRALQSLPIREAYVRYGHNAVAGCEYCTKLGDYELFAFSSRLVVYVLEVGWGMLLLAGWTRRQQWRAWMIAAIAAMGVGETWALRAVEVDVDSGKGIMWHDTLHLTRHTIFLLLILLIPLLPPSAPAQPSAPLLLLPQLQALAQRLSFLRIQRRAIPLSPELRQAVVRGWEKEARGRTAAWGDEGLRERAKELGMDLPPPPEELDSEADDESEGGRKGKGEAWERAREAVGRVWEMVGLPRVEHAQFETAGGRGAGAGAGAGVGVKVQNGMAAGGAEGMRRRR